MNNNIRQNLLNLAKEIDESYVAYLVKNSSNRKFNILRKLYAVQRWSLTVGNHWRIIHPNFMKDLISKVRRERIPLTKNDIDYLNNITKDDISDIIDHMNNISFEWYCGRWTYE